MFKQKINNLVNKLKQIVLKIDQVDIQQHAYTPVADVDESEMALYLFEKNFPKDLSLPFEYDFLSNQYILKDAEDIPTWFTDLITIIQPTEKTMEYIDLDPESPSEDSEKVDDENGATHRPELVVGGRSNRTIPSENSIHASTVREVEWKLQNGFCFVSLFPLTLQPKSEEVLGPYPALDKLWKYYLENVDLDDPYVGLKSTLRFTRHKGVIHIHWRDVTKKNQYRQTVQQLFDSNCDKVGGEYPCINGTNHRSAAAKERCTQCKLNRISRDKRADEQCPACLHYYPSHKLQYHDCTLDFKSYEEDAWEGDAMHQLDVIRVLRSRSISKSRSHVELTKYIEKNAQVQYLLEQNIVTSEAAQKYAEHRLATIFEANYFRDRNFRKEYLEHTFGHEARLLIMLSHSME